jgi:hypothetical protein
MLDLLLLLSPWWLARVYARSKFVRYSLYLTVLFRQLIALINSFPGVQLFGSGADARRFLFDVMSYNWEPRGEFPVWLTDGYSLFVYGLRFINALSQLLIQAFNPEFTLQILNVVVYVLSVVVFENRFGSRVYDRFSKFLLSAAFFYPFSLTFHTYILRESFQLLLVALAVRLFNVPFKLSFSNLLGFCLILLLAPVFHFTYPFPILISVILFIILNGFKWGKVSWSIVLLMLVTPLVLLIINWWIGSSRIASLASDLSLSGAQETYLNGAILTNEQDDTRTFYFQASENLILLTIYYRLRPYLLEIRSFLDLALFSSNMIALYVYLMASRLLLFARKSLELHQKLILMTIIALMPYDLFWSLGTVNWGTAARHSSATTVLLLLLFAYYRASRRASQSNPS